MSAYTDMFGGAWKFPNKEKEKTMSITPVGEDPEKDRRALAELLGIHILDPYPQPAMMEPKPIPHAAGTVYLSGPILGETYQDARFGWRKYVFDRLLPGIRALSPMRHESYLAEVKGKIGLDNALPEHYFARGRMVYEKDKLDILRSDIILANFIGAKRVSIGTVAEIGMAAAMGKTIIVTMDKGNIHDHPFVVEPAAAVLATLEQGIEVINSLLSEGI